MKLDLKIPWNSKDIETRRSTGFEFYGVRDLWNQHNDGVVKWNNVNTINLIGTNTNSNALAGSVGEYIESIVPSGSPVALVSGTAKTVTSISLTPGDWDVRGNIGYIPGGTIDYCEQSISQTNNTSGTETSRTTNVFVAGFTPSVAAEHFPTFTDRISLAITVPIYLVAQSAFTVSMTVYGIISARRMR